MIVEQLDDFCVEFDVQVLQFRPILLHAELENIEKYLFEVCVFCVGLIVLQKVEACSQEALDKVFIDFLVRP